MKASWGIGFVTGLSILHYSIMGYAGFNPDIKTESLMAISLIIMFSWWALDDAKQRSYHRPYEFGAFILFAWPVVLPAYLVATRGWRGMKVYPAFILIYYLPWLSGWAAYYLNHPNY